MNTLNQTKLNNQNEADSRLVVADFNGDDFCRFVDNWVYVDAISVTPSGVVTNLPKRGGFAVWELRPAMSSCA